MTKMPQDLPELASFVVGYAESRDKLAQLVDTLGVQCGAAWQTLSRLEQQVAQAKNDVAAANAASVRARAEHRDWQQVLRPSCLLSVSTTVTI